MKRSLIPLLASVSLFTGCPHKIVLPDDCNPHQLAKAAKVTVWCHDPQDPDKWEKCEVWATPDFWLAGPCVVNGSKPPP